MKYAIRITRDLETEKISVFPPVKVPDNFSGYRYRKGGGVIEALRIEEDLPAAMDALEEEKLAAAFADAPETELQEMIRADVSAITFLGGQGFLWKHGIVNRYNKDTWERKKLRPNPRTAARIRRIRSILEEAVAKAKTVMPDLYLCGNPRRSNRRTRPPEK